jgi:ElaB/YqjD/DUF883 family membrane-anchored ribosome-binding protein
MQTDYATGHDVRQTAEDTASTLVDQAQQVVETKATTQKERAAETIGSVAQSIREAGSGMREQQPQIASFADQAATRVEDVSNYIRDHEIRDLISETERLARREPLLFLGGAFAVGFVAARFLKASSPAQAANGQSLYGEQYPTLTAGYGSGSEYGSAYGAIGNRGSGNGQSGNGESAYGAGAGGDSTVTGHSSPTWQESGATTEYSGATTLDFEQPDVTEAADVAGLDSTYGDEEGRR